MRHIVSLALLAGCASTIILDDPCACVTIPDLNGALSLAMSDEALSLDGDAGPAESTPITGNLYWVGNGSTSANFIEIDGIVALAARWGDAASFDMTAPAPLTSLYFQTSIRADTDFAASIAYDLGPQGGSLRLREIVANPEGGYRIRGGFSGQICKSDTDSDCTTLSGNFAFDAPPLPSNGNATALIPGG